ncbi:3-ketoacyl-CoA thiolase [Plasticicumulans lactativorans]|uniref:3-ketoacyl-CoA thiolase n=1 Tax=Plasticicumulans lactativorans TaxID=1133106 RepID=A0A4R2L4X9_9GAMM|nr:acetyl-CoA C-acetyltransferase [Plasticicumulans lactativorans]TCO78906.1 3-ketoacyl-CoA thiolase [Plasticicumulans lactativorans]
MNNPLTPPGLRRVAIVGGVRTPFCRANTGYAELGNLDLLVTALQGLVERYGLAGVHLDEVGAGAVTAHSRDWNLAREALLSTALAPSTPAYTLVQACGTSLQAALQLGAKIASGAIDCGIAAGVDTASDVPLVFGARFAHRLLALSRARTLRERLAALRGFSPRELAPVPPSPAEPRTGLSMGEHCERMAKEWRIGRAEQDALALDSHRKASAARDAGFLDELLVPCAGVLRDNLVRDDASAAALAALKPVFDRSDAGTLTAGNSTPLTDGAAAVLLASEDWARAHGLPVLAWLGPARVAAVDFVNDAGLLMAPTVAVAELLGRSGLRLQDFDFYEIHEAFAAQVLCTLRAWESADYCRAQLGLAAPLGAIDPARLNPVGSSLAYGHPFAATGARILATAAKQLAVRGGGRALVSVCTAGGMGLAAIVEGAAAG